MTQRNHNVSNYIINSGMETRVLSTLNVGKISIIQSMFVQETAFGEALLLTLEDEYGY